MLLISTLAATPSLVVKTSLKYVLLWNDIDQEELSNIAPILTEELTLARMDWFLILLHHNLSYLVARKNINYIVFSELLYHITRGKRKIVTRICRAFPDTKISRLSVVLTKK